MCLDMDNPESNHELRFFAVGIWDDCLGYHTDTSDVDF